MTGSRSSIQSTESAGRQGAVPRIDPASRQVTDVIDVPGATSIYTVDGRIWVAGNGTLTRLSGP